MEAKSEEQRCTTVRKPQIYELAEGFGSVYGRYVRKRLCQRLIKEHGIRTVLEAPCNTEDFASPGTQSVVFAQEGCSVTLLHPVEETARKTRELCSALGMNDTIVHHHPNLYQLPFQDCQFDLVWNFDYVQLVDDPRRFIAEMARVSANLVLIMVGNAWNFGYPLHALLCLLSRRKSRFGQRRWMTRQPIEQTLRRLRLTLVEKGLVDVPPWPTFDVANGIGQWLRRNTRVGDQRERNDDEMERMIHKLTFIEYGRLPQLLKTPFSHQLYFLARKTHVGEASQLVPGDNL